MASTRRGRSRKAVGSSRSSSAGSWARARASMAFCFSPSLSLVEDPAPQVPGPGLPEGPVHGVAVGGQQAAASSPYADARPRAARSYTDRLPPCTRSVRTMATRRAQAPGVRGAGLAAATGCRRARGACRPARVRSKVDLPAPLGPSRQTSSPGAQLQVEAGGHRDAPRAA